MATKPEAVEAEDAKPAKSAKSKKMLISIIAAVLVLALGGGGAFFYVSKQRAAAAAAAEEDGGGAPVAESRDAEKTLPVYLPMDNLVVNLADEGGERVAQVGITLQVRDAKASDEVKAYMPTIRSGVLMLLSQRTAAEMLTAQGKQKLIEDILLEASRPFGGSDVEPEPGKKVRKKAKVEYPVSGVLFSSLIVQ